MKRGVLRSCIAIAALILAACQGAPAGAVAPQAVVVPSGMEEINSVVAMGDGRLVVSDARQIWQRQAGSSEWQALTLPSDTPCQRQYLQLAGLPDGRLGFICLYDLVNHRLVYHLVAYDWSTGVVAPMLAGDLPDSGFFSWDSQMNQGVYASVDAFSTLYTIDRHGIRALPATLTDAGRVWYLPDSVTAYAAWQKNVRVFERAHPVGLLHSPAWRPHSSQVALWATLEPIGIPYALRGRSFDLYLLDTATLQSSRLLQHVWNPLSLIWDADGQWLFFSAGDQGAYAEGIWAYHIASGTATLINSGKYNRLAWSAADQRLFAVRCNGLCSDADALEVFDMRQLLARAGAP